MRHLIYLLVAGAPFLTAQPRTPVHQHLLHPSGRLTSPSGMPADSIAREYLRLNADVVGLSPADLLGLELVKQYTTAHNGVTHLVYRQRYQDLSVYNTAWTVNLDQDGAIINTGGTLAAAPAPGVAPPQPLSVMRAIRAAVAAVNPALAERFAPFQIAPPDLARHQGARFAAVSLPNEIEALPVWFAGDSGVQPAWLFYVDGDDGASSYEVVIDDATQATLSRQNLTWFDDRQGMVFDNSSPQPNPTPGVPYKGTPPFVQRTMQSFSGDSQASPSGWVSSGATQGNNAVAGLDPLGTRYIMPAISQATAGIFDFPLQLGPSAPVPTGFPDAATTNMFYWVNRAHDLYYALGFDEGAGNYQQDNFGKGGIAGDPLFVYSQFGSAGAGSAALNNAFFTSRRMGEDGSPSMLAFYLAASSTLHGFVDLAYDPEVMVHEYTHGVSTRLIPQFGSSVQGGAMGEAISDFFSLELTLPSGTPVDGSYPVATYFAQNWVTGIRTHPFSTDMSVNPLMYGMLGTVITYPEVHADGEIWVEALWEVRAALIRQFGEDEGRRRVRMIMMDAMKLSPPAPSMLDLRDSILLADRVDFGGASQLQLWQAFARRGMGVLAASSNAGAVHIAQSIDVPGDGPSIGFYDAAITLGEPLRLVVYDPQAVTRNVVVHLTTTYGDAEDVYLDRKGSTYTGTISTTQFTTPAKGDGLLEAIPSDVISASYAGGKGASARASVSPSYTQVISTPGTFNFGTETLLHLVGPTGSATRVTLPFDFPFYDKTYNYVWLFNNGLLSFTGQLTSACADTADLLLHAGIAPMWMGNLVTNGSAQPGEDVYRSSGSDFITFRWAAEGRMATGTVEPVNFSTTLFSDGRIEFHYGSGNHNLVGSTCAGLTAPIGGLGSGHETYSQSAFYSNILNLEDGWNVLFFPPFGAAADPQGVIEFPGEGDHASGPFNVTGYRFDPNAASLVLVTRVDVLIDGVQVGNTQSTVQRPDICSAQSLPGCPFVGFSFPVNPTTLGLAPGPHTIQLLVTNSRGATVKVPSLPRNFTLDPYQPPAPVGQIESLSDGGSISGNTTITGYAYAPNYRVLGVDLLIDGINYAGAIYGLPRPDVCGPLSPAPPNCPGVGFSAPVNTKSTTLPLATGPHSLWVRIRDELGNFTNVPATPLTITVK